MQTKSKKVSRNAHNIFMQIFHRILEYFRQLLKRYIFLRVSLDVRRNRFSLFSNVRV